MRLGKSMRTAFETVALDRRRHPARHLEPAGGGECVRNTALEDWHTPGRGPSAIRCSISSPHRQASSNAAS